MKIYQLIIQLKELVQRSKLQSKLVMLKLVSCILNWDANILIFWNRFTGSILKKDNASLIRWQFWSNQQIELLIMTKIQLKIGVSLNNSFSQTDCSVFSPNSQRFHLSVHGFRITFSSTFLSHMISLSISSMLMRKQPLLYWTLLRTSILSKKSLMKAKRKHF